jgi:hypothetical protein
MMTAGVLMVERLDNLRGLLAWHGRGGLEGLGRLHHGRPALPAAMRLSQRNETLAVVVVALIWLWVLLPQRRRK